MAERLGGEVVRTLEDAGYVAVSAGEANLAESVREMYEILVTTMHVMMGSSDAGTRILAEQAMRRIGIPDHATPFEDLRVQIRALEAENKKLKNAMSNADRCLKQR